MIGLGGLELLNGAPQGLWLALIGFFVVMAAGAQATSAQMHAALSGVQAGDLMSAPAVSIPEHTPVAHAARAYFRPYRYTAFPVVDELGRVIGMVSIAQVEALTRQHSAWQELAGIVDRDPGLIVHENEDVAGLLERPALARVGRAVVVDEPGRPLGLISITDVQRACAPPGSQKTPPDKPQPADFSLVVPTVVRWRASRRAA